MSINLTDELLAKTKKGKIASAKQVFLEGDQENLQQIGEKTHQLEDAFKDITVSGGASTATAVSYNNETSGMTAVTAQGAIDELAAKNKTQDTIIEAKADKSEVDTELDKKFNKENIAQEFGDSKDKIVSQFALPFREIESPEFIKAIVDTEDHFLFGIQLDGSIEWGKGIPAPIRTKLQEIITQCQQDKTDLLGSINTVNGILDKTTIKDEAGEIQDTPFRVIENEEFIMAIVDADDRILYGIYRDTGKPYYPQNDMYHISQSEEFLWVILDAANHPLLGIQQDGTCWAAKAQWLDDIKAIKEALLSIDETLKTFQPKEDGKGLINLDVAESLFYISNDEYIIAVVDAENRILAGIKYDGELYFPNHEMYSVITNEEWLYAIIDNEEKVLCGFRANDGHMIVGGIDINNVIVDVAYIKERTAHLSTIDNDEYLSIETDAEGKVIGYTAPDGSHYIHNAKSETIPTEFEHIEDPEGRIEITTDADGKVMSYRDADGKKHEHDMEVTNLEVSNLNLQGNSVNNIQDALKANGFDVKTPIDLSDKKDIHIPIPNFAIINILSPVPREQITKKSGLGTVGKDCDVPVEMQFWDLNGNYFSKQITISAQGDSSLLMKIKNNAFDFTDGTSIKFGNWVSQDSFHLKKYYIDAFRGQAIVGYNLMEEIYKQHPIGNQKPFSYLLNQTTSMAGIGDISLDMNNTSLCHPDGFPIIEYWNGEYGGIYTMALKKHRSNYNMNKNEARNIILDGIINNDTLFGGKIDWTAFEVKNPKNLYCVTTKEVSGWSYVSLDNINDAEEIAQIGNGYTEVKDKPSDFDNDYIVKTYGDNPPRYLYRKSKDKYYKLIELSGKVYVKYDGDNPKELIDSSMPYYDVNNKDHIRTDAVKKSIIRLSQIKSVLVDNKTKSKFEEYFNVPFFIDYFLHMQVCAHNNWSKNWIWVSYDGNIWCPTDYDNDSIFGQLSDGTSCWMPSDLIHSTKDNEGFSLTNFLYDLYSIDIESKYKELRNAKVFNAQEISSMLNNWVERIGYEQLKKEHEYCSKQECPVPSYRDEGTPLNWSIGGEGDGTLYSDNATYNKNDVVIIKTPHYPDRKYTCQIDGTTGIYPTNYKNYPNFGGFYNSIYRVRKWLEERITKLDEIFKYNV